jgi:hypothetical protein
LWNLVSYMQAYGQAKGVQFYGAEESIWM